MSVYGFFRYTTKVLKIALADAVMMRMIDVHSPLKLHRCVYGSPSRLTQCHHQGRVPLGELVGNPGWQPRFPTIVANANLIYMYVVIDMSLSGWQLFRLIGN